MDIIHFLFIWQEPGTGRSQSAALPDYRMATQRLRRGAERKVVARLRRVVLVCLMACAHWGGVPVRAATSASGLDIPSDLFFAPQPRILLPAGETPRLGKTIKAFLPRAYRKYRQRQWQWRRADNPQPAPQEVEIMNRGSSYAVQADDMGRFLSACVWIAVAPDIVSRYCTDFVGPATNPVPDSRLDIPSALFLGPQPAWIRRDFNLGQAIAVSLPPPQNAYRVSGWRWRRADSPRPAPQDMETVASGSSSYVVQADDAGRFLSACIHVAVAPDIASEYCTDFAGPVTDPANLSCAPFKPPPPPRHAGALATGSGPGRLPMECSRQYIALAGRRVAPGRAARTDPASSTGPGAAPAFGSDRRSGTLERRKRTA